MESKAKSMYFHSTKYIWKYCLRNDGHFVSSSMCQYILTYKIWQVPWRWTYSCFEISQCWIRFSCLWGQDFEASWIWSSWQTLPMAERSPGVSGPIHGRSRCSRTRPSVCKVKVKCQRHNSLTWHHVTWSRLVQLMAYHLVGARPKPLPEPMLTCWRGNYYHEQISAKFESIYKKFHWRKSILKCCLYNGSHFVNSLRSSDVI